MIAHAWLARPVMVIAMASALALVLAASMQDTSTQDAKRQEPAKQETTKQDTAAQEPAKQDAASGSTANAAGAQSQNAGSVTPANGLAKAFAAQGIHLDLEHGLCAIRATVDVREDLLEYLLVNPRGAAHESTFVTAVLPSQLNVALLALGVKPGRNASWSVRNPAPTPEEMSAGTSAYVVEPPQGDGFYVYAAWKSGGETFLYRAEDLLLDRATGQTMRRHKWVYLGSRLVKPRANNADEAFAADLEGNLINIAFFEQGNTLLTAALPECLKQTIWMTNFWIVPPRDSEVEIVFSKDRLVTLPKDLEQILPAVEPAVEPAVGNGR